MAENEAPTNRDTQADAAPEPASSSANDSDSKDLPSLRQRLVAGVVGLLLIGLVAAYALLPCRTSYEQRAIIDEMQQMADEVVLMPCYLKAGGSADDPMDLVLLPDQQEKLTSAQREQLADILDRDRWLFMGRLTEPDCWQPHHLIVFKMADGNTFSMQLSLDCGRYKAGGFGLKPLPPAWHWRLKRLLRAFKD